MLLVIGLYFSKNFEGFVGSGRFYYDFLKTAFERTVFLNILAILVESGGANALNLATSESRFEQIGSIHRARSISGTHYGVNLVDKQYDVGIISHFVDDGFDAFFKLAAIFGASHHRSHVERKNALVLKNASHFTLADAYGETFYNSRFTHTRFAYEHRIVFLASAKNLRQAFYFAVAAYYRVEMTGFGLLGEVLAIFVEHGSVGARCGGASGS